MELGVPTPIHFYESIPLSELAGWMAYLELEPLPQRLEDARSAKQSQILHGIALGLAGKRGVKTRPLEEYMARRPSKPKVQPTQTPETVMAIAQIYAQNGVGVIKSKGA